MAAAYAPALIEGNAATATGETRYSDGEHFFNLFELEFDDDGRCSPLRRVVPAAARLTDKKFLLDKSTCR